MFLRALFWKCLLSATNSMPSMVLGSGNPAGTWVFGDRRGWHVLGDQRLTSGDSEKSQVEGRLPQCPAAESGSDGGPLGPQQGSSAAESWRGAPTRKDGRCCGCGGLPSS